jgi:hypothetical protein
MDNSQQRRPHVMAEDSASPKRLIGGHCEPVPVVLASQQGQHQRLQQTSTTRLYLSSNQPFNDTEDAFRVGRLEELKQREQELAAQLQAVRREKLTAIRSRPLTIGVVGFGRFGQFIARTFAKYGRVVVTSRSDYSEIANGMGVTYIPLDDPDRFMAEGLDVIVFAVSILSFKSTLISLAPHIEKHVRRQNALSSCPGPLVVDVLSVKGESSVGVLLPDWAQLFPSSFPQFTLLCLIVSHLSLFLLTHRTPPTCNDGTLAGRM